ncbi:MAG: diacylglycerol kinase family protein [Bacillota bacterium]
MKTAVIVNPVAGGGKTLSKWVYIKQQLINNNLDFAEAFTEGIGSGVELAKNLQKDGYDCLLVAGGDGTLHEVVNGLDLNLPMQIGVLPTGTGNDFARALHISRDVNAMTQVILRGNTKAIDLGQVNDRKFINIAGVGFDAQVAKEVNQRKHKYLKGSAAYLVALAKVLVSYKCLPVHININGYQQTEKILFLAVANAPYVGGGMKVVPQAVIDDGRFHICLAKDVGKFEILKTLPKIYHGKHTSHPQVLTMAAHEVRLESDYPFVLHADGEVIGGLPAVFKVLPKALTVLLP